MRASNVRRLLGACTLICLGMTAQLARAQDFRYEAEPRAGTTGYNYAESDPAPRMASPAPVMHRPAAASPAVHAQFAPDTRPLRQRLAARAQGQADPQTRVTSSGRFLRPASAAEPLPSGQPLDPFAEEIPAGNPTAGGTTSSGEVYYDNGLQPEPMLEPQPMGQYAGPGAEFSDGYDQGYYDGADCYNGTCYLRRWWNHVSCLARNGAYTENIQLFTGKQGFKGPVDQGVNGDFGYHGGANWGMPLLDAHGIGYQIGANYIGSDFAGRTGPLGHRRAQFFVTSGVFRRAVCGNGWQGGAVVDYLRDDFYIQMDLTQVRAELSYLYCHHEVGFWGAFSGNTSTHWGDIPNTPWQSYSFEANNQYNVFYRYEFCNGTVCRTWCGLSAHGDAIFGGDATVRFSERVGLMANYNYLLPRNDDTVPNNVKESWNLTISFVWYPGYKRCDSWTNPYRPLFYTADNGWFLSRQADTNED
jgi:hypothetical protein